MLLPLGTLLNVLQHPGNAALGAFLTWLFIAASEVLVPALRRSPAPRGSSAWLTWVLRAYVPLHLALIVAGMAAAAQADWPAVIGLALGIGFVTGAQGITYAHELGHGRNRADRALGWLLMASVNYAHFMVEHYRGHHVRAATFDDPASARLGESLWRFLPRTLCGSLRGGWALEAARLRLQGKSWASTPLLWTAVFSVGLSGLLVVLGAWKVLVFWWVQSAFAVWLLETVNYIEHYGLRRAPGADGRPEPFGVQHAWNADHLITNSLLANLQRHSDHHMHAWKPFPELNALPGPQLPTGYAGCLLLAALPPLWFGLMHPRLASAGVPAT